MPIQVVCPACQRNLQIPDAHSGKRVKCPCGSLINTPTTNHQSQTRSQASAPVGPVRSPTSVDLNAGDLFDELTDSDFQAGPPVGSISTKQGLGIDRQAEAATLQKFAGEELPGKNRKAGKSNNRFSHQGSPAERPLGVLLISIWNFIVAAGMVVFALLALGLLGLIASEPENEQTAAASSMVAGAGIILLISAGLSAAVGISLLIQNPGAWCFALFGYGYSVGDRVSSAVVQAMSAEETPRMIGNMIGGLFGVTIAGAILAYLFSGKVRHYFRSAQMPLAGPIAAIIGGITISTGVVIAASMLMPGP